MQIRRWGSATLVNTTTEGEQFATRITALANGRTLVAWSTWRDNSIRAQILDALGKPVGGELLLRAPGAGNMLEFAVTGLADGGFYLVWNEAVGAVSYLLGRVYTPDGAVLRDQPVLFSDHRESGLQVSRVGGGAVVAWNTASTQDINHRIFDGAGVGGGIRTQAASGAVDREQSTEAIATTPDGTRFVVVRSEFDGFSRRMRATVWDAAGVFVAESLGLPNTGSSPNTALVPAVTWISNTDYVVAWYRRLPGDVLGSFDVEMQIMTTRATGGWSQPVTDVIRVNGGTSGEQWFPQVAALPGGRFVVAWLDTTGDLADASVRMQAFDAGGNRLGGEAIVTAVDYAGSFKLAALADGRVAIIWSASGGSDIDDGDDVFMQIVDPRDGHVTGTLAGDTLYGHDSVNDEISGYRGDDTLYGLRGDDSLWGGIGNDLLDGGRGADDMHGGTGNDTYLLDNADDAVFELARQGADTIQTGAFGIDLALYPFVENVTLTGTQPIFATGTAGTNTLNGEANPTANLLTGLGGNDTYIVGAGDGVVEAVGGGTDTVQSGSIGIPLGSYAGVENIILTGALALFATGTAGANAIDGERNSAANLLTGLGGDDTYTVGVGDTVVEAAGGGADTVQSATLSLNLAQFPQVENLALLGALPLTATGNAGANGIDGAQNGAANILTGLGGNDIYVIGAGDTVVEAAGGGTDRVESAQIDVDLGKYPNTEWLMLRGALPLAGRGTAAADILDGSFSSAANVLTGLGGNDTYVVGAGDTVVEAPGAGTDRVQAWNLSLDLALFPNVENATLTGTLPMFASGTDADNVLVAETNSAANILTGGKGNDTYVLGVGDMAVEAAGGGVDTAQSGTISLDMTTAVNFENITLTGTAALNATGNAGANVLTGNAGANVITGNGGGDDFIGLGGADTLVGGAGADRFRFLAPADSAVGAGRDVIQAFSAAQGDRIDLSAIDANGALAGDQGFAFLGTGAFTGAAGQLRYQVVGADVVVQGSIAGGVASFEIRLAGVSALVAGDFLL